MREKAGPADCVVYARTESAFRQSGWHIHVIKGPKGVEWELGLN